MANNMVSKISNSFSTGGGGTNFEQNIQALFLLSLLVEGFCPILNEPTTRVAFQAKRLGYDVDDIVVFTERKNGEGKILCQVKHSITVSNSGEFKEVINAAWSDFNKERFDQKNDKIVLAVAYIALDSLKAIRDINDKANKLNNESGFISDIEQARYSSEKSRDILQVIRNCLDEAITDYELWKFCRCFTVVLFDLDYATSVNATLARSLIHNKSNINPSFVWDKLFRYAANCNQSGAIIDKTNIDQDIIDFFIKEETIIAPPNPVIVYDNFFSILLLIGSWNGNNQYDKAVIEKISGISYERFETKARGLLAQNPDYLDLKNGLWKVKNKKQLAEQCRNSLENNAINQLFENATSICYQNNRSIETDWPYILSGSGHYDNSNELRKGIIEGICILRYSAPQLIKGNEREVENKCVLFIRKLLHNCDWVRWASIQDQLLYIAEINPDSYLKELEWNIVHNTSNILKLFPKKEDNIFESRNYMSQVLWSLEMLSWLPEHLVSAIRCLGLLEALPYDKTSWSNTPINSITSILLPWYPQTNGDREKQKASLIGLKADNFDVFWRAITNLLPGQTTTTSGNPKPQYIPTDIPKEINVSRKDIDDQYKAYVSLAIENANVKSRLTDLVDVIDYMDDTSLDLFLEKIDEMQTLSDEQRKMAWIKMCDSVMRMQKKQSESNNIRIAKINSAITKIEPTDIRVKYQRLYLDNAYYLSNGQYADNWKRIEEDKANAIHDIYSSYGILEVETFGKEVHNLLDVGLKFGSKIETSIMLEIVDMYHDHRVSKDFFSACFRGFISVCGVTDIINQASVVFNKDYIADILAMIPFCSDMISIICELDSSEKRYWEKALIGYSYDGDNNVLQFVTDKLTKHQRYASAVNIVGNSDFERVFSVEQICSLLQNAGTKKSVRNEKIDEHAVQKLIGWLQKQDTVSIETLSDIEFIYLPVLGHHSGVEPKAIRIRLGLDADYFCNMMETVYRRKTDKSTGNKLSKELSNRFYRILFEYNAVPGVTWDGVFNEKLFAEWMGKVVPWSKENDRYEVTMHTIGAGLSYSTSSDSEFPPERIVTELNKPENEELRRGYLIGLSNQRGVHTVDPEGKPELELAERFDKLANKAENMGYTRYSDVLRELSSQYRDEAQRIIEENNSDL